MDTQWNAFYKNPIVKQASCLSIRLTGTSPVEWDFKTDTNSDKTKEQKAECLFKEEL